MPCFSFHELGTFEAQQGCVHAISRHLTMGGLLAIALGVWSPPTNSTPPPEPQDLGKPKEEGYNPHTRLFTRMWTLGWGDPATQTHYRRFYFEESDDKGQLVRRFVKPEPPNWSKVRYLGRYEMELILEKYGLAVETVYGDWDLNPFDSSSRCMLFLARKARRPRTL